MFSLKPILVEQSIELPTCMYPMKPLNSEMAGNMQDSINNSSGKTEVELLEEKQNRILKKLDELKQTLIAMRGDLKLCNKPPQPAQQKSSSGSAVKKPIDVKHLDEIIINAHPSNVPFGVLAMKNMWSGRLNVKVDVFTHSSVKESDVSKAAKEFTGKVSTPITQNKLPTLRVTIIWKNVENTQMITSPTSVPVLGEVNIIRYLNRVGPNEFFYEADNYFANLSDLILDVCYQLSKQLSTKERQTYVQLLSQRLGKSQFFNDSSNLSVADIAVSSILKKLFASGAKDLPANLSKWLQKASAVAGY